VHECSGGGSVDGGFKNVKKTPLTFSVIFVVGGIGSPRSSPRAQPLTFSRTVVEMMERASSDD